MIACLPPVLHRATPCIHLLDGSCYRTLFATTWPSEVTSGWLQALYREPVDVTLVFDPIPNDVAAEKIGDTHDKHAMTLMAKSSRRLKTHERVGVEATADDTLQVVRDLVSNRTRMFRVGLYVRIPAPTHDEGDALEQRILSLCRSKTLTLRRETVRLEEGYFQAIPFGVDLLQATHTLSSSYAGTTFPFATGEATSDGSGVYFGDSIKTGAPILVEPVAADQTEIMNDHRLYLGESGAGKSYAMSLIEIARTATTTDAEVNVLDVKGEYIGLTLSLGGTVIVDPDDEASFPERFGGVVCWVVDPTLRSLPRFMQMRRILERIWEHCLAHPTKYKRVIIDEAWEMLRQDPESAFLVWRFGKEGRGYRIALTTGTQDVNDIDKGDKAGGENVLRNARTKVLLTCEPDALDDLARVFRLSEGEQEFLDSAQQGEALLIRGRNRTAIKITGSEREHRIVSASLSRRTSAVA